MFKEKAKSFTTLLLSAALIAPSVSAFAAPKLTDVSNHWAKEAIEELTSQNCISGYEDNTYRPDNFIKKAELITIINKMLSFTEKDAEQFSDVSEDAWYAEQMLIARAAGYFSGIGGNLSGAEEYITREDAFVLIVRAFNIAASDKEISFTDESEISEYALEAIKALVAEGIVAGYEDKTIRPKKSITRGEIAWILWKIENLDAEEGSENTEEIKDDKKEEKKQQTVIGHKGGGGGSSSSSTKNEVAELVSLDAVDITTKNVFDETEFNSSKLSYDVTVQSDIYGVLVKAKAENGAVITVTADKDAYAYGGTTQNYAAGDKIEYNETLGGYVVLLDQTYEGYDSELVQNVTIEVKKSGETTQKYTLKITRECDNDTYAKFQQKTYAYAGTNEVAGFTLGYNVYYPEGYETSGKKYPVVLALHGDGQSTGAEGYVQPIDMILKRYQMATTWVKDVDEDVIVVAPQEDKSQSRFWGIGNELQACGMAAYDLLENEFLNKEYVDTDRVYITGLSLGGMGTYSMLVNHPDTFAGALIDAGAVKMDGDHIGDYNIEALSAMSGRIYICHAEGDPSVKYENYEAITAKLNELSIKYETKTWTAEEVFYPHPHFSWTPMYADEEIRDWLLSQTKENSLTSLDVVDITAKNIFDETKFDASKTEYSVNVQSDIYGALLKVTATAGSEIKVTAGSTTYKADTWGNITPDYTAGTEIPYSKVEGDGGYEGYIIPLDQSYEGYDSEFVQPVTITVTKGSESKTYTVTITRETLKDVYDKFTSADYTASNGETIPYQLYVPSDYEEGEHLPVILALHGSGQRTQPLFMVLKRYQMATIWAKDSEEGTNRCIVLAPQCNTDENGRNWTDLMRTDIEKDAYKADPKLNAAYELLEKVIEDYDADTSRIYATGLSAGGYATYALALAHPETFAAIVPVAGGVDTQADLTALEGMGIWTIQATNDPLVSYKTVYKPTMEALEGAGLKVNTTLYKNSEVFYPNGHFSWTPGYANEEMRTWLFEQVRTAEIKPEL